MVKVIKIIHSYIVNIFYRNYKWELWLKEEVTKHAHTMDNLQTT